MRLTSIKLSGFKSFVDPTTIQFKGNRVGIVGPNGCGKSNIIDAVRWVLGESRASELRGESMRDVIFNGTNQRRPSGRASVELMFENAQGKAGGQWGRYSELAVKRILTRDGGSTYYINNVVVRRRDIQEIFLGTGLGPRAYAIIGQGMIARIIEAKPEELRVFLEEAAGVSKYRQRRRETENRLEDTRANLNRVSDIQQELEQNLVRLKTQAEKALQYQRLEEERNRQQKLMWIFMKDEKVRQQAALNREVDAGKTVLEQMKSTLASCNLELEKTRERHAQKNELIHEAQGSFYATNVEIGRIETRISYIEDSRKRLESQLAVYEQQSTHWMEQERLLTESCEMAKADLEEAVYQGESRYEDYLLATDALAQAETASETVHTQYAGIKDQLVQIRQKLAVENGYRQNLEKSLAECNAQYSRRKMQKEQLEAPDAEKLDRLRQEAKTGQELLDSLKERKSGATAMLNEGETVFKVARKALNDSRERKVQLGARLMAQQELQKEALSRGEYAQWLEKHGLKDVSPLWKSLRIEPGWENAVIAVLAERFHALELESLDQILQYTDAPPPVPLSFFSAGHLPNSEDTCPAGPSRLLVELVTCDRPSVGLVLGRWLQHVFVAENLKQALEKRVGLKPGWCLVVPEGHIIEAQSIRLFATRSEMDQLFSRQNEIERLKRALAEEEKSCKAMSHRFETLKTERGQLEKQLGDWQLQERKVWERLHAVRMDIVRLEQAQSSYAQQMKRIESDLAELQDSRSDRQRSLEEAAKRIGELDFELSQWMQKERDGLEQVRLEEEKQEGLRQNLRDAERQMQQAEFEKSTLTSRIADLEKQIGEAIGLSRQAKDNAKQQGSELNDLDDSTLRESLQELLDTQHAQERNLVGLRQDFDELEQQLRHKLEEKLNLERDLQPQQDRIVSLQLKEQAARMMIEQYEQKLAELPAETEDLFQEATRHQSASGFQQEIDRISRQISELGPVNLGAALELEEGEKRQHYLDEQVRDLSDAVGTLEDAIRRIDRETRMSLKNTFDEVNSSLQELFPMLFGGGHAKLLMTGTEILDSGVQIIAQPPGKKNATIHLLSGGEKALTAIALVFSLFRLNPAPFCLLDEVDAPLDDANTERFGNMVKKMSDQTQFLFISHNRIAMEKAEELVGVTMQEQGVSRIVTVDINDAAKFSEEVLRA